MNIFVGNLSFSATEADLEKLFRGFGNVASAVIVMRKEKRAPKSRGFGFVEMPDQQEALAAIAALNGKEFIDRVIDVNPTRPKTEAQAQSRPEERKEKKDGFIPVFNKPGTYRGGRRTRSYMTRRALAGIHEEVKPRPKNQENPMRWRKRRDQPRPWQKSPGEHKPWEKVEGGARPREKPAGEAKPWSRSSERPQESRFKGRKN